MGVYSKNSEILFLYDAKLTNPNGDPDDENKPRIDYEKEINLVSDVRLKRYIRDYLESIGYEIFVAKVDGEIVDATERLRRFFEKENKKVNLNKLTKEDVDFILSKLIDVRLFGATMPIKAGEEGKGASSNFTGPVQFTWGYSLNKVELVTSNSITSTFAGRDEAGKGQYGTFGKDWRLYYSLIAFYGIVSGYRAKYTNLSEEDVALLDKALLEAIPQMASTRSKIGQKPRLLLRIEYSKPYFLGDLRNKVKIDKEEGLRDITDYELDITNLKEVLEQNKDRIDKVYVFQDPELRIKGGKLFDQLKEVLGNKVVELTV
ncbi:type I-B CRISPR-associated protein Cas7/Csh2 [Dictyoglomus thermophilum]|uniref:CRISPR-associated protein, Csh2 family n=2 Tax=Dictyoglomus thermophilum TaxID=14 RepID=B5YBH7_DICT6|nr:type I-B CRISPR-associated protein Cas7/Csh2 [Dictyoglomus thermophilum]ACI19906.1 CRISPR-associated protein, Csh2 family [Dictyoglomus thermophilum H-6-12]MCX7721115.1 type I-B CRISPR-associated protein Cas7/Csh2 [Dictyoglomus thermophilum]TYT21019.1 type I-B CRISPR-associated protein Cas7/Csh2 [Dictyoglomus thermophilum]